MTMKTNPQRDLDYGLWVLLNQVYSAVTRCREDELRPFGISPIQAAILFIIKAIKGSATPAEISRWLFRERHTVKSTLDRMEKQGLVKQTKGVDGRNRIKVTVTRKGEEAYRRSRELTSICNVMSSLSVEERENLWKYLNILRDKALEQPRSQRLLPFP